MLAVVVDRVQVVLQWNVQRGVTVIPHTLQRHEVLENLALLPGAAPPPTQTPAPLQILWQSRMRLCAQARSPRTTRWGWRSPTRIWRQSQGSIGASACSPSTGAPVTRCAQARALHRAELTPSPRRRRGSFFVRVSSATAQRAGRHVFGH